VAAPQKRATRGDPGGSARGFCGAWLCRDPPRRPPVSRKATLFYFHSKEDLFKAVIRQELVPNLSALSGSRETSLTLLGQLVGFSPGLRDPR
jgi:hypothetical protein